MHEEPLSLGIICSRSDTVHKSTIIFEDLFDLKLFSIESIYTRVN